MIMAPRKTFNVKEFKNMVNDFLLHSPDDMKEQREGQISLCENILMETGNYNGFKYLNRKIMNDSRNGCSVGIREQKNDGSWNFDDTDHTRIKFF